MVQGKVKTTASGGITKAKNRPVKAVMKKGARNIPPKKTTLVQLQTMKKKLESGIKHNIEQTMIHRAATQSGHLSLVKREAGFKLPAKKDKAAAAAQNKTAAAAALHPASK
ncbi:hypothetical protein CAOG_05837 [Capsaspora owczarzaki ATCC 30864]|uniref:Uncharacterized protein n=1 Tax=Capsaspora owczarzaki (strain ATCC 30864) TaxID=595528 RepID=A0A0D2X438_CAPO3|nr:hypothetical protein CAOG_05837 [Capsaspora owczarzaki ATCC 30864]KJE95384.1 hypothetical protein CAOG_005837 [Capsaspora owczarzaki ATCC 30864]|eukprot:XP_004345427.1 hypothetical protein CAOG_05837 [Capsaspora owczarzaki ATCC 30864]